MVLELPKRLKKWQVFCTTLIICTIVFIFPTYTKYDQKKSAKKLIPNQVHYILFNNTINFINYLSLLSVLKVQQPVEIIIHTDNTKLSGHYWEKLQQLTTNTTITVSYLPQPTHVFGQPLSSLYHVSDIARIQVLQEFGGIYLDFDVLVLNILEKLRAFEMVIGCPKNKYMGTQVLMAKKHAMFLTLWLQGYRNYHPRDWYYNAGQYPTEQVLQKFPHLVHCEDVLLGVDNLLAKLHSNEKWVEWENYYTIHLLSRHEPTPKDLNEDVVRSLNSNFGAIARRILDF